jgi:hypothetical protein
MFDVEQAVSEWRRKMLAAGIKSPVPLEELESHLREEIEGERESGVSDERAFEAAVQRIGQADALRKEFAKERARHLRARQAKLKFWIWMYMVVSFALIALFDHDPIARTYGRLVVICSLMGLLANCKPLRRVTLRTPLRGAALRACDALIWMMVVLLFYMGSLHEHDRFITTCFLVAFVASIGGVIGYCMILGASYSAARKSGG